MQNPGSVTKISMIPRTSLFLTGSKDGDVKLWDAKAAKLIHHWPKLHERHTFLQPNSRGYGGIIRVSKTETFWFGFSFIAYQIRLFRAVLVVPIEFNICITWFKFEFLVLKKCGAGWGDRHASLSEWIHQLWW